MVEFTMKITVDDSTAHGIMTKRAVTSELAKLAALAVDDACIVELWEGERSLIVDNVWVG